MGCYSGDEVIRYTWDALGRVLPKEDALGIITASRLFVD